MSQFDFGPDTQAMQSAAGGPTPSPITYMGGGDSCSTHLIDGNGTFNEAGLDNFIKEVNLGGCGLNYAVVSIMGPQSSGKSTLLNHLFGTNFKEMDAEMGRSQTTKGIWLAHAVGIEPCTLVMDIEGSDGAERGEDDTAFEKQSTLFALAISDVVMINMWCHDIGREHSANRPLLKIVFQAMLRLFSRPRKRTLMFVIRDKTLMPTEKLETKLREDLLKIWDNVPKPEAQKNTPLSEFFNVEVVALSNHEYQEEQFKKEVANLRQRFFNAIAPGGLAGDRRGVVPASAFSFSAQNIWKVIKDQKDLDLPTHKVMVATVRCEEIANEKFSSFIADKEWRRLKETVGSEEAVNGFGRKVTSIIDVILSEYDAEAIYFEEGVRSSKQKLLKEKLLQLIQPAHQSLLGHIRSRTFGRFKDAFANALKAGKKGFTQTACGCTENFMAQFDEACADADVKQANWKSSEVRERDTLRRDMNEHIAAVRASKLSELTTMFEKKLYEALAGPVEAFLVEEDIISDDTWPSIRKLLHREIELAVSEFSKALSGFEMDDVTEGEMISWLKAHARGIIEAKAKEAAGIQGVLLRMKDRFIKSFFLGSNSKRSTWTKGEDMAAIMETALSSALNLLSVMTAIRLDDHADSIKEKLFQALLYPSDSGVSGNLLASNIWDEVPPSKTLLTPAQCKYLWSQLQLGTAHIVEAAKNAQEANKPESFESAMGGWCPSMTHLIDENGTFNEVGFDNFIKEVKLGKCGLSYAVVAIMGPQSSGKSTLLNHLFGTNFKEMDAEMGRSQTTKGIWLAHCVGIEPCTLVMDIEGSDGVERGEDDNAFEKQSALFALAISDVVMINMWCHDIGREHGANRPLLKTVFQVMLRLFSVRRKTTLMFVIRDKTRTPLEILEIKLREDIKKIWDNVPKPKAQKNTPLSEFFKVEVVALSNHEYQEEQFKKEVADLRQGFFHSIAPGGLAGDRRGVIPASVFSISAHVIWKLIKADKHLYLPAHKIPRSSTLPSKSISAEDISGIPSSSHVLPIDESGSEEETTKTEDSKSTSQGLLSKDTVAGKTDMEKSNEVDAEQPLKVLESERYKRDCLQYCSLFPAEYEFSRDTLIWSWIAAGLINSEHSDETAAGVFDTLISSNYILQSGYDRMSDRMKYKVDNDNSPLKIRPSESPYRKMVHIGKGEHLSIMFEQIDSIESIRKCTHLKTLLLHKSRAPKFHNLLHDLFLELKLLTKLDLSGTNIEELPSSIDKLEALKFLDISETPIRWLPASIGSLDCLETLLLQRCLSLYGLPNCISELVKLKHLVVDLSQLLQSMPIRIGKLTDLQTLGAFVIGTEDGSGIRQLENMNKLKGSLCLMKLENILDAEEAGAARLCNKKYLSRLEFIWGDLEDEKIEKDEKILEKLTPHVAVQELKIVSYSGGKLPSWISSPSFSNMDSITLHGCRYCEELPDLGALPSLKYLKIVDMDKLVRIDRSSCQDQANPDQQQPFPKLETLYLERMSNLETWTGVEDGHFPCLQQLSIKYCRKLKALPNLSYMISLQHLEICNCPELSCLPEGGLPTSLQSLMLSGCPPKLKHQCCEKKTKKGEKWTKVIDVPTLYIDHQKIGVDAH